MLIKYFVYIIKKKFCIHNKNEKNCKKQFLINDSKLLEKLIYKNLFNLYL